MFLSTVATTSARMCVRASLPPNRIIAGFRTTIGHQTGCARALSHTVENVEAPSELWVKQRQVFGGATLPGMSKYLKQRPKGDAVASYYPEVEVHQLMFYTNENIETRLERLKVRRARGKGTPKKGSGKRAKMKK